MNKEGLIDEWGVQDMLNNINMDRSSAWTDYTMEDLVEGLHEFTEYRLIGFKF